MEQALCFITKNSMGKINMKKNVKCQADMNITYLPEKDRTTCLSEQPFVWKNYFLWQKTVSVECLSCGQKQINKWVFLSFIVISTFFLLHGYTQMQLLHIDLFFCLFYLYVLCFLCYHFILIALSMNELPIYF